MSRPAALITGASGGIGRAIALRFAKAGYRIAAHYHQNKPGGQALLHSLRTMGTDAVLLCADLTREDEAALLVQNAIDAFSHIDTLVCNAGSAHQGLFHELTSEEWRLLFSRNVDSVFYPCRFLLPHMLHRKSGSIVTVSSIWGLTGASCEAAYSAAKGAVVALTKALAKEYGPSGIRVNCVAPGVIKTPMNGCLSDDTLDLLREETPLGTIGTPEQAAESVYFLASPNADFITGQVLSPNGGILI